MKDTCRLYTDLAWLWPLWGDAVAEYGPYCETVTRLIRSHARRPVATLLDLGCGGGKNLLNLRPAFEVTGLDLSAAMLAQAAALNPGATLVQGDMRTCRLGRTFDAVLMDDAISHLHNRADFAAAFRTAHEHLNAGGVLIATPDVTKETFQQNRTTVTPSARGDLHVVFIENTHDPDPTDDHYETTIVYLIRDHGRLRVETDHWTMGLFTLDTWRQVLRTTGFTVHEERFEADGDEYPMFVGVKAAE